MAGADAINFENRSPVPGVACMKQTTLIVVRTMKEQAEHEVEASMEVER